MRLHAFGFLVITAFGCGSPAQPTTPNTTPTASQTASASPIPEPPPGVSVVQFEDLGISFAVPPGFHVVGDDELAARIRSSATPRLQADLQKRAAERKGLPLLTLSKEVGGSSLDIALSVVVVPADATSIELLAHQQLVLANNVADFELASPPKALTVDGVSGAEMSARYTLNKVGARVASRIRVFVRNGMATLVTAVWADKNAAHADLAAQVLDGLHFRLP